MKKNIRLQGDVFHGKCKSKGFHNSVLDLLMELKDFYMDISTLTLVRDCNKIRFLPYIYLE